MNTNPWIVDYSNDNKAEIDMFCFHYAGGGASSFRVLRQNLPETIGLKAIQIPGRENRVDESYFTSLHELAEEIVQALRLEMKRAYVFYGHSMGALLAFEVARALRRAQYPLPETLFAAAHRSPDLARQGEAVHTMNDEQVMGVVKRLNGTANSVLSDNRVMAYFLPTIKADFQLLETYRYVEEPPLECPICALGGSLDKGIPAEDLERWAQHSKSHRFDMSIFPGGHFFHKEHPEQVAAYITSQLAELSYLHESVT